MCITYPESPRILEMSRERLANLYFIDVTLGVHIFPLVFDTGASMTVLGHSTAKATGAVATNEYVTASGNAGAKVNTPIFTLEHLSVADASVTNARVLVVPDEALDFGLDDVGRPMKVCGFLGWDFIRYFRWTLDSPNRRFRLEKSGSGGGDVTLSWDNMPIIQAFFDGRAMNFGFDSGNTQSMLGPDFLPLLPDKSETIESITGVDDVTEEKVWVTPHIELEIGNQKILLRDILVLKRELFPTRKHQVMGLLAADIIQGRRCVIDAEKGYFKIGPV